MLDGKKSVDIADDVSVCLFSPFCSFVDDVVRQIINADEAIVNKFAEEQHTGQVIGIKDGEKSVEENELSGDILAKETHLVSTSLSCYLHTLLLVPLLHRFTFAP